MVNLVNILKMIIFKDWKSMVVNKIELHFNKMAGNLLF